MYYIGFDIGSSSVKVAIVEIATGKSIGVVQEPETEMSMLALKNGWAEQKPEDWIVTSIGTGGEITATRPSAAGVLGMSQLLGFSIKNFEAYISNDPL